MKKIYLITFFASVTCQAIAQTTNPAPYCMPVFGTGFTGNGIGVVEYGSVVNSTGVTASRYNFYNNLTPHTAAVGSIPCAKVGVGGSSGPTWTAANSISLHVDYNHDYDISGEGSSQSLGGSGGYIYQCGSTVPDTALAGPTRMRIVWTNNGDPCSGNSSYVGEVEDYIIVITKTMPVPRATGAINITGNTATLAGTVNANGTSTASVDFEYGQTTSYTNSITGGTLPADTGKNTPVNANITGLSPYTIYHYRIKTTNAEGTNYSADKTFTTTAPTGIAHPAGNSNIALVYLGSGKIQLSGLTPGRSYQAAFYDVNGRSIFKTSIGAASVIESEKLVTGMYFIRLIDAASNDLVYYGKLIMN